MELSIEHWLLIIVALLCGVGTYRFLSGLATKRRIIKAPPCLGKAVLVKRDEVDKEVEGEVEDESEACSYCTDDDREVESCLRS